MCGCTGWTDCTSRFAGPRPTRKAAAVVKAVPYGRDPRTCAPCAYTRWRHLLDTATQEADPARAAGGGGGQRQAVLTTLIQLAADPGVDGHVCRVDLPDPADPGAALFTTVHKSGAIGTRAMSGQALNQMLARRAADAGYTTAQIAKLGGQSLRSGFRHRSVPPRPPTPTRSCGRPGTATQPSWRSTPENTHPS